MAHADATFSMRWYRFAQFTLDVRERRLLRGDEPVPLTPKVFDTLVYLVERHGRLVTKEELLQAVWGDAYVEEGCVARTIHVLRKALAPGDGHSAPHRQLIETVPTKGYRFVEHVITVEATPPAAPQVATPVERGSSSYARSHGGRLAAGGLLLLTLAAAAWATLEGDVLVPGLGRLTRHSDSGAAHAKYQSGRMLLDRHLPGDTDQALGEFDAAIRLDPRYAVAHAGRADAQFFRYWRTGAHDDIARARLSVRKAIELDPQSAYARTIECRLLGTYDWDFAAAETACRLAVRLDPTYHEAHRELGFLLSATGRSDDALREMDAAVALAPTSFNKRSRGVVLYFSRRYDEAIAQLQQVEATDPEYLESSRWITRAFEQKHDEERALEYLVRFREWAGGGSGEVAALRTAFAEGSWPKVLRAGLPSAATAEPTLDAAGTFAQLGDRDGAFGVLERMIDARRVMVVHMEREPRLDPLRSDPRFDRLARRVGLRPPRE